MTPRSDDGLLLESTGIAKALGGRVVLKDASLKVHQGEVVTLIGPNGAGKSTLIRILLGLLAPDKGTVYRKPGLSIGYLPQRFEIDPALPLTVNRFLSLGAPSPRRIAETLEEVGVGQAGGKQIHDLSGGELRRVLLARAMVRRPQLLIFDEPLQGVDVGGQADLYRLIGNLRQTLGAGVLLVSHDLHLVMAETDHVVCLNQHICCAGRPEAVSRDPAYLSLFGPGVAVYAHVHDHTHDHSGEVAPLGAEANGEDDGNG